MAMSREEILQRMVTGAEYIERDDITPAQREKAWARYNELEAECNRLKEEEAQRPPEAPEQVQSSMEKIRETLKKEKVRR